MKQTMQQLTALRLTSYLAIALSILVLIPVACLASDAASPQTTPHQVGGWYPVFFEQEDQALLQNIIDKSKSGLVSKLIVDYDKNLTLAKKITDVLKANCQCVVESRLSENRDTDSVKFNHQRVTVLVYSVR
jgi:hypothetical protein